MLEVSVVHHNSIRIDYQFSGSGIYFNIFSYSLVHLILDLESLHLILSLKFFLHFWKKITSGGLILYLEKFGLILYSNF